MEAFSQDIEVYLLIRTIFLVMHDKFLIFRQNNKSTFLTSTNRTHRSINTAIVGNSVENNTTQSATTLLG